MEGNKDEALRSVKLAQAAIASGDRQRADKFIRIAQRLDPSLLIADLLTPAKRFDPLNGTAYKDKTKRGQNSENLKTPKECVGPSSVDNGYTEENVRVVHDIRKNKDYYAILGVERSCSLEEIMKACRRLCLKIHPDKNKAPGAEDAFKMVSKAFKCLGNDQSRKTYDHTGALEGHEFNDQYSNVMRQRTARRRRQTRNSFYNYEEDLDPDEIFTSFFYAHDNSFRTHNAYRARGAGRQEQQRREHPVQGGSVINLTILMHLAVVLLFVLFAFIPVWQPEYALQRTYNYPMSKVTEKHGVEYFVSKRDFDLQFPQGSPSRDNLEEQFFRDYKTKLGRNCRVELHRRKWAKDYPTPHCDKLRSLAVP